MIIYKAQNKINNKIYIGVTKESLDKRIYKHFKCSNHPFGLALRKYGLQSFEFSIIDLCLLKEIAYEKEVFWIKLYNCKTPNGYNLTDGGEGAIGRRHSEESKKRMSVAKKGKPSHKKGIPLSEEMKNKMSESRKGKPLSKRGWNQIRNLHKSKIGKHLSEETKRKIGDANKGKSHSHIWNKGTNLSGMKGKHHSEETKRKISESEKNKGG